MKSIGMFSILIVLNVMLFGCSQETNEQVKKKENTSNTTKATQMTREQLEQRIVQLEKRVEELEQKVELQESNVIQRTSQSSRALENEAKNLLATINRAQQAHFLENNRFASNLDNLSIEISKSTENYNYKLLQTQEDNFSIAIAVSKNPKRTRSLTGIIYFNTDNLEYSMKICILNNRSNLSSKLAMDNVIKNDEVLCPYKEASL